MRAGSVGGDSKISSSCSSSNNNNNNEELLARLKSSNSDTLSVRVSRKDVDVVVADGAGMLEDIDLQIEIPKDRLRKAAGNQRAERGKVRRRIWRIMRRLGGKKEEVIEDKEEQEVVFIRDTISVKGEDGRMYNLEMDLRVEVDGAELRRQMEKEEEEVQNINNNNNKLEEITRLPLPDDEEEIGTKTNKMRSSRSCGNGLNKKGKASGRRRSCLKPSKSLFFAGCPLNMPWRKNRSSKLNLDSSPEESEALVGGDESAIGHKMGSLGVVCANAQSGSFRELSFADETPRSEYNSVYHQDGSSHNRSTTDLFRFTTV